MTIDSALTSGLAPARPVSGWPLPRWKFALVRRPRRRPPGSGQDQLPFILVILNESSCCESSLNRSMATPTRCNRTASPIIDAEPGQRDRGEIADCAAKRDC